MGLTRKKITYFGEEIKGDPKEIIKTSYLKIYDLNFKESKYIIFDITGCLSPKVKILPSYLIKEYSNHSDALIINPQGKEFEIKNLVEMFYKNNDLNNPAIIIGSQIFENVLNADNLESAFEKMNNYFKSN